MKSKSTDEIERDIIIAGAGMGGLTAGALLSKSGYDVQILEASHVPGGCSSSYFRKGYIFESGATTLIGFDEHQPLKQLESMLDIQIPKVPLDPSMSVHMNGKEIVRYQEKQKWIDEAAEHFGEKNEQQSFWDLAFEVSDVVWKVSEKNIHFPPIEWQDYFKLLKNDIRDLWVLPYTMKSVKKTAIECGISNPEFYRFLDEQLMISSQADSEQTPFLFGAPAITYTNSANYYVPGGLIEMVRTLTSKLEDLGGTLTTRCKVISVEQENGSVLVRDNKGGSYRCRVFISNIPVWNMPDITQGAMGDYFQKEASKYEEAWGAFTMGIVTDDTYPDNMPLHHQIHLEENDKLPGLNSGSIFVSLSRKGDNKRAKEGERVLNVSTHTEPDFWFNLNGEYEEIKSLVEDKILQVLKSKLSGFGDAKIKLHFGATPVSWSNWIFRKKGRVGGIPQSADRSLLDWTPNKTPFDGIYLCGDTVFPGQGIPGVTLSGIYVYYRVLKYLQKKR